MLCSQFPDATLADVKDILLSSVQKLGSLTGLTATGGMLDLGAAMGIRGRGPEGADLDGAGAWRPIPTVRPFSPCLSSSGGGSSI